MISENGIIQWRKGSGKSFRIAVTGDICPRFEGETDVLAGRSRDILSEIQPVLDRADLRLAQWETVLTDTPDPILKCGPHLGVPTGCCDFLKKGKIDVALLANNHTGDHGESGVMSTLDVLKKAGIKTVGAGRDQKAAAKALHLRRNGFRITILNFCEQEFGCAWKDHAGTNAMDELANLQQIMEAKAHSDILLVVIHGGNEFNPIPTPRVKQLYRSFAKAGADAVVNIHCHCPQGMEVYEGVPVIYSPGNFFFPRRKEEFDPSNFWWSGYLPVISFDGKGAFSVEITPYVLQPDPWKIHILQGKQRSWYYDYLNKISRLMLEDGQHWFDVWCAVNMPNPFSWIGIFERETLMNDPENAHALQEMTCIRHMMTCQAHRELFTRLLLLLERKQVKSLLEEAPLLKELQTAHFAEYSE